MLKKYTIATTVFCASVLIGSAAEAPKNTATSQARPTGQMMMRQGETMPPMPASMPVPMTGDKATDEKIKALQKEMEAKIKAIHDEYQAKIKALIGDKKIINNGNGSTTPPAWGRGGRFDNATGSPRGTTTRPMMDRMRDEEGEDRRDGYNGTGTPREGRDGRPMMMQGNGMPRGPEVRGASTGEANEGNQSEGIIGFFSRFFRQVEALYKKPPGQGGFCFGSYYWIDLNVED